MHSLFSSLKTIKALALLSSFTGFLLVLIFTASFSPPSIPLSELSSHIDEQVSVTAVPLSFEQEASFIVFFVEESKYPFFLFHAKENDVRALIARKPLIIKGTPSLFNHRLVFQVEGIQHGV